MFYKMNLWSKTYLILLVTLFRLVAWDYHRWRGVLIAGPAVEPPPLAPVRWAALEQALLSAGAAGGMAFFLGTRSLLPAPWPFVGLLSALISALAVGGVWVAQDWTQRRA